MNSKKVPVHLLVPDPEGPILHNPAGQPAAHGVSGEASRIIKAGSEDARFAILCCPTFAPRPDQRVSLTGEPQATTCPDCKADPNFDDYYRQAHGSREESAMTTADMRASVEAPEPTGNLIDTPSSPEKSPASKKSSKSPADPATP